MIAQSELAALKCTKRAVLEQVAVLLAPYAPHIAEEMWHQCGHTDFVIDASWPVCDESYLVEDTQKYPVQFNGKVRFTFECPKNTPKDEVEKMVLAHEETAKYLAGSTVKKIIVVPGRIVNIVI